MTGSVTALRGGRGAAAAGRQPGAAIIAAGPGAPTRWPIPIPRRSTTLDDRRSLPPQPQAAGSARPAPCHPGCRARPGPGPRRAGQGRSRRDRRGDREGRRLYRYRDRGRPAGGHPAGVGDSLFFGEWLLGSMGWGVLHGVLLFIGDRHRPAPLAGRRERDRLGRSFLVGSSSASSFAFILACALSNRCTPRSATRCSRRRAGVRPLVVGVAIWAIIGLIGRPHRRAAADQSGRPDRRAPGRRGDRRDLGAVTAVDDRSSTSRYRDRRSPSAISRGSA